METQADILRASLDYFRAGLLPALAPDYAIEVEGSDRDEFNAEVGTDDLHSFRIEICQGYVAALERHMAAADVEDIVDVQKALSVTLFGSDRHHRMVRQLMLQFAVFFVMLHELCHVLRGHLHHWAAMTAWTRETALQMAESTPRTGGRRASPKGLGDTIKLMELDADQLAFELLAALSYEFLVSGDAFSELLPTIHEADALPPSVERALAEISLSACSASFFLMEVERKGENTYPLPETRLVNLVHALMMNRVFDDKLSPGMHAIRLTDKIRGDLTRDIIPMALNAAQFGMACAESMIVAGGESLARVKLRFDEHALLQSWFASISRTARSSDGPAARELRRLQRKMQNIQQEFALQRRSDSRFGAFRRAGE